MQHHYNFFFKDFIVRFFSEILLLNNFFFNKFIYVIFSHLVYILTVQIVYVLINLKNIFLEEV